MSGLRGSSQRKSGISHAHHTCVTQGQKTVDPSPAVAIVGTVLYRAHTSRSLACWGHCHYDGAILDFPTLDYGFIGVDGQMVLLWSE
jgi:hypothetical protein